MCVSLVHKLKNCSWTWENKKQQDSNMQNSTVIRSITDYFLYHTWALIGMNYRIADANAVALTSSNLISLALDSSYLIKWKLYEFNKKKQHYLLKFCFTCRPRCVKIRNATCQNYFICHKWFAFNYYFVLLSRLLSS